MKVKQQVDFAQACEKAISVRYLPKAECAQQGIGADSRLKIYDPILAVAEFENCLVNRYGFVMLDDGTVIADTGYRHNLERSLSAFSDVSDAMQLLSIADPAILVNGHNNYYDWHMNWLPRVVLADRFSDLRKLPVVLHEKPEKYVVDSLRAVTGRGLENCIQLNKGMFYFEKLYVPAPFPNPMHSPFAVRCYNDIRQYGNKSHRHLYLSRGDAHSRKILNELAVLNVLSEYGFEIVQPETLSYQEQVLLFSEARTIVGAHGAGLTNMLFCAPGFSAVELFNNYYSRVYWSLATTMGVGHYKSLKASRVMPFEGAGNQIDCTKNAHFDVNLEELRKVVEVILYD